MALYAACLRIFFAGVLADHAIVVVEPQKKLACFLRLVLSACLGWFVQK